MTTTYAVIPQVCPGSKRMPTGYRGTWRDPLGVCRGCKQDLPVDWHGADPEKGYRTVISHALRG